MKQHLLEIIKNNFGVDEETFIEAINDPTSASARGSILGVISENLLKKYLIKNSFKDTGESVELISGIKQ